MLGLDRAATLALVIDCFSWELPGWHISRGGKSRTTESALEQEFIAPYTPQLNCLVKRIIRTQKDR